MKKIILKKLIYQNYLKTTLTSILFIEIILIFFYFNTNNYMIKKNIDFLLKDLRVNTYEKVNVIKSNIKDNFLKIENDVELLQNEHQNILKYANDISLIDKPSFSYSENGMYYKTNDNGGSSLVVSKNTKINKNIEKELIKTELFDKNFKSIVDNDSMIVAAYYNSKENYNRYYPFIKNAYSVFPPNIEMENYNFYYLAKQEHNPDRKVVWTDVYLDPAGQGWMLSAIAPIYIDNIFKGTTGVDITVNNIINKFLDFKLPYDGSSFLIDKNGNIIAMTDKIAELLNIDINKNYVYRHDEKIEKTVTKMDDNIFDVKKSRSLVDNLKKVVKKHKYDHDILIDNKSYLLFTEEIDKTSWYIISLIDKDNILSQSREQENYYKLLGYIIIGFIFIFYVLFFIYLYKKAKDFVKMINIPLLKIIKMTNNLGNKKDIKRLNPSGILEIDELNDNFNKLADELEERTKKLIEVEASRALHQKLSNTDPLTKAYNRRFLEDFSKQYFEILKRENGTFSLIAVDIDDFKFINDKYGHDIGDDVLVSLVNIIQNSIRDNDFIIRLGGDEFLVLLPSTSYKQAKTVARKILNKINNVEKDNKRFTISIGCSEYKIGDKDINTVIKKADIALYKAKKMGKNSIV